MDAVFSGQTNDAVLASLIELAMLEIVDNRPLFQSPLDEPIFWRRSFKPWVSAGLKLRSDEVHARDKAGEQFRKQIAN